MMLAKQNLINAPSILAVDDDVDNLYLIAYVIEAMNFKCYGVNDARSVLDLAVDKTPKLILVDIVMPKLSGFEVLRQRRSEYSYERDSSNCRNWTSQFRAPSKN